MANWTKIILGTGLTAGVIALIKYGMGVKHTNDELQTVLNAKVLSLDKKGLTVRANVTLKNPTSGSIKIKQPTVEVLQNGKMIGSSKVGKGDFSLAAFEEKALDPVTLNIPVTGLFSLVGALFSLVAKKQPVTIAVKALTNVDFGWVKKDFSQSLPITLKPKKA